MPALSDADLASLRQQLLARQDLLRDEVRRIKEEQADTPSQMSHDQLEDAGEVGEEHTRHAMRHAEQERDQMELVDIDDALDRMNKQAYGECVDCGIDIPLKRLQAQPAARRCVKCQEAFEHTHPNARISASL
jgi:RNA polymerase-binding protein DksA